jgi:hypothetical protein
VYAVVTHEHEIGNAPVQRSSRHAIVAAVVGASSWIENRAARAGEGGFASAGRLVSRFPILQRDEGFGIRLHKS